MKIMLKPKIIDAELYTSGMEDGFCSMSMDDPAALKIPYIYERDEYMFIEDGDYIVTDSGGNRFVITQSELERMYDICSTCDPVRVQSHEQTMDIIIQRLDNVETRLHKLASMAHEAWSSLDV